MVRAWSASFKKVVDAYKQDEAMEALLLDGREKAIFAIGCQDYLIDPDGEGAFSVDSDKERLVTVMRELM